MYEAALRATASQDRSSEWLTSLALAFTTSGLFQNFNYKYLCQLISPDQSIWSNSNHLALLPKEAYATFNMGIGLVVATDQPDLVLSTIRATGLQAWNIGSIEAGEGHIEISTPDCAEPPSQNCKGVHVLFVVFLAGLGTPTQTSRA